MKPFIYSDEVDRIAVGENHWVDIKKRMSYGDRQRLTSHFFHLQSLPVGETPKVDVDLESGQIVLMQINIAAWSFTLRDGTAAPITTETIAMLDPDVADIILEVINERNPAPKAPALTKNSGRSSKARADKPRQGT